MTARLLTLEEAAERPARIDALREKVPESSIQQAVSINDLSSEEQTQLADLLEAELGKLFPSV